jgi:hypothetical protein
MQCIRYLYVSGTHNVLLYYCIEALACYSPLCYILSTVRISVAYGDFILINCISGGLKIMSCYNVST